MEIENKIIVVTGGSGGIGQALAVKFIHEKAKVVIALDINFDNFELESNKLISKVCDVTDEKELNRNIGFEKEWRYYGSSDTRHNSDPSRCHLRKNDEKNIFKDVENMKFNEKIVSIANTLYEKVTKGSIFRGNSRNF